MFWEWTTVSSTARPRLDYTDHTGGSWDNGRGASVKLVVEQDRRDISLKGTGFRIRAVHKSALALYALSTT